MPGLRMEVKMADRVREREKEFPLATREQIEEVVRRFVRPKLGLPG